MARKFTSLILFWAGLGLILSSVVLYIEPHGRVAFWSQWRLWGLEKTQWDDIHVAIGVLFVIALVFHLFFNWNPIIRYMRIRTPGGLGLVSATLAITVFVAAGALFGLPPVKQVLDLENSIKKYQTKRLGNPPFGHAELAPIEDLARFTGVDPEAGLAKIRQAGLHAESIRQNLKEIAQINHTTPKKIYRIFLTARAFPPGAGLPEVPPPGIGMLSVKEFSATLGIPAEKIERLLAGMGLKVRSGDVSLKEIAVKQGMTPRQLYRKIKNGLESEKKPMR